MAATAGKTLGWTLNNEFSPEKVNCNNYSGDLTIFLAILG